MILNLLPSIAVQTHTSLSNAVRCWEAGATFRIYRGPLVSKATLPRAIHRVRFWPNQHASYPLGEWETAPAAAACASCLAASSQVA